MGKSLLKWSWELSKTQPRARPGETSHLGLNLDIAKGGKFSLESYNLDLIFFSLVFFFFPSVSSEFASILSKYRESDLQKNCPP